MRDLLLLHGAAGAASQFDRLAMLLSEHFKIYTLDFEGHGLTADRGRPFRIEYFAENVLDYVATAELAQLNVFGYSMGGYVALYLDRQKPGLFAKVATLGTKFEWSADVATRESKLLDPDKILEKVPQFADQLRVRHSANDWRVMLGKTVEMMHSLAERNPLAAADFGAISSVVRIMVGDRDSTVSVEEAARAYRQLPRAELGVFPNTPHPLEKINQETLANALIQFFKGEAQ